MYKLFIRPLLFLVAPETIHHFTFRFIRIISFVPGLNALLKRSFTIEDPSLERKLLGLTFKNPVGLAAGFDKDALLIDGLATFGFGFIEIGTLTPKPQDGNPRPRLFRLPQDQALINRMGFNNRGVAAAVGRLKKRSSSILVGGNIGKNKNTPNENAFDDYAHCFEALYPYVDYFVLNVSSPNTPGLRALQEKEPLKHLLQGIRKLSAAKEIKKPIMLKIAPDLTQDQLDDVVEILIATNTDGVIATNTTISRDGLTTNQKTVQAIGAGGLSGKPLSVRSTEVIKYLRTKLGKDFPIIGVGGIMNAADALDKIKAGADLVQVYTGFIYEGPSIVKKINRKLLPSVR
ncbi:MAG TPA: quinone-dependent dihydroorotate dehydrogenase [Cyclobacteriaceae bacterium]|nr:quinone-dependent dihydroorotate dehydrogenase [Cyclobacteriaceae bacterium]